MVFFKDQAVQVPGRVAVTLASGEVEIATPDLEPLWAAFKERYPAYSGHFKRRLGVVKQVAERFAMPDGSRPAFGSEHRRNLRFRPPAWAAKPAQPAPPAASRSDKVGRNGPCPCGSGNKYKKCCGAANRTATPMKHARPQLLTYSTPAADHTPLPAGIAHRRPL